MVRVGERIVRYTVYGSANGVAAMSFGGSPSTRWKRPDTVEAISSSGLWMVMPDRPGYGGSTRQPGRTVASVVADAVAVADALGWERFAVTGGSGGGPHALAFAAPLPHPGNRRAGPGGQA